MEDLDVPSFFIDSRDRVPIRCQLTTGEIQGAGAAVFVCKDLPSQSDWKLQSFQPANNGFLLRPFDLIYAGEFFLQPEQYKMTMINKYDGTIFGGQKPAIGMGKYVCHCKTPCYV